jgi:hypothetical protein
LIRRNPANAHATAKFVHHPHVRHPALAAQAGKLSPRTLLGQHFDQQVHGMDWREQAQQVNAIKLRGGVFAMPSASGAVRPSFVDEIVRDEGSQEFEQCRRAGGRKIGIHGSNITSGNLTRQRQ